MQTRSILSLLLLSTLSAACGEQAYKLVNVPYCENADGPARGRFTDDLRWIYRTGHGGGTGPLDGMRASLGLGAGDSVHDDDMLLAIVACPALAAQGPAVTTVSSNSRNAADELTTDRVPDVCPGQKVVFHGAVKATDDTAAKDKGYAGVLRLPDIAATCAAGTVKKTTSADIEARPK